MSMADSTGVEWRECASGYVNVYPLLPVIGAQQASHLVSLAIFRSFRSFGLHVLFHAQLNAVLVCSTNWIGCCTIITSLPRFATGLSTLLTFSVRIQT